MKRGVILCLAIFCAGFILAQDIISLKTGERIEDVTIKSVTDTEILYELNGTETTIEKSEVSAILYEDGRFEEVHILQNETNNAYTSSNQPFWGENPLYQYYDKNGKLVAAFLDKKYSKECRKKGQNTYMSIYKARLAEYKKAGLSSKEAKNEAFIIAIQAGEKAVHECAGDL